MAMIRHKAKLWSFSSILNYGNKILEPSEKFQLLKFFCVWFWNEKLQSLSSSQKKKKKEKKNQPMERFNFNVYYIIMYLYIKAKLN